MTSTRRWTNISPGTAIRRSRTRRVPACRNSVVSSGRPTRGDVSGRDATLTVQWQVRTGGLTDDPETVPDWIRLQWLDRIDDRFRALDPYADHHQPVPGPDGFTPTFGLHQDETHETLGPAHFQLERAGDRAAERASVPYDLVGEPPVKVVSYFLTEASAQLARVHDSGQY